MSDAVALLERLAKAPKPFVTVLRFSDGTVESIAQPRRQMAERLAERYRGKIGRTFRLFNADHTADRFPMLTAVETEGF
jgi:hypothetical protein